MQLEAVSTDNDLRKLLSSDEFSFRFDCGVCQPAAALKLTDRGNISSSIALHYCIYSCKVELDDIRRGLLSLGFVGLLERYPVLRCLFESRQSTNISVEVLEGLFVPDFSVLGSNARAKEEATMMFFIALLHEIEGVSFVVSVCPSLSGYILPISYIKCVLQIYVTTTLQRVMVK